MGIPTLVLLLRPRSGRGSGTAGPPPAGPSARPALAHRAQRVERMGACVLRCSRKSNDKAGGAPRPARGRRPLRPKGTALAPRLGPPSPSRRARLAAEGQAPGGAFLAGRAQPSEGLWLWGLGWGSCTCGVGDPGRPCQKMCVSGASAGSVPHWPPRLGSHAPPTRPSFAPRA